MGELMKNNKMIKTIFISFLGIILIFAAYMIVKEFSSPSAEETVKADYVQ
jgi:hypothetical protein